VTEISGESRRVPVTPAPPAGGPDLRPVPVRPVPVRAARVQDARDPSGRAARDPKACVPDLRIPDLRIPEVRDPEVGAPGVDEVDEAAEGPAAREVEVGAPGVDEITEGPGVGLVAVTAAGRTAAAELAAAWPDARIYPGSARDALAAAFTECAGVVCFLATGATVRLLAPLLAGKASDPGVVCVDEGRRFAVALVGGHAGGANALAERVAATLGATPVVTTASDAAGTAPLDNLGADLGFRVEAGSDLAAVGAAMLSGEPVDLYTDAIWPLPPLPPSIQPAPLDLSVQARPMDRAYADNSGMSRRPAIVVSDRAAVTPSVPAAAASRPTVVYRPPSLVVGVGASRGAPAEEILDLVDTALADAGLSARSVRHLATVDAKRDEPGIVEAARRRGWPLVTYPAALLAAVPVPHPSEVVRAAVGTPSVAEAASLLDPHSPLPNTASGGTRTAAVRTAANPASATPTTGNPTAASQTRPTGTSAGAGGSGVPRVAADAELVVPKRASRQATVAVARHRPRGRLALVGLGPGDRDLLTPRARAELARAAVVVGLDQYVDAVRDLLRPGVRVLTSGLGEEEARAAAAVDAARAGHAVALVGSGDAGVYAMASPALDLADGTFDVVGVPGITAALSAAALLGAPLGHDHALISLSDLHTPWEVILRRVRAVAAADLVVAFYNPRSRTRRRQLPEALAALAEHRPADTPVGIVTDAFRPGQRVTVTTLAEISPPPGRQAGRPWGRAAPQAVGDLRCNGEGGAGTDPDPAVRAAELLGLVGMTTTVVVGNSRTRLRAGLVVTPRGYAWS
jgi:cobalt-precorrin 5A hydrolase / precorrin-3B C17-methyltransferase